MRFAILCTAFLACGLEAAEVFYTDVTETHLPPEMVHACMDVASGDIDRDGDVDMVLAIEFESNIVLFNDGTGSFSSVRVSEIVRDSEDVGLADLDGDDDLDLVFVSEDDLTNELYLNDGNGRFTDHSAGLPVGGMSNALEVIDLNADGALDLLIGNFGADRALINDGRGNFTDASEKLWQSVSDTQDLELIDVEGDGDQDVAVANEGQNQLFLNEDGRLIDVTRERMPLRNDESREMKAADFDADGDLDLMVSNVTLHMSQPRQDVLLLNDGFGVFTEAEPASLPAGDRDHYTVQVLDIDQDGDTDMLLPSSMGLPRGSDYRILLNDGRGRFLIAESGSIVPMSIHGDGLGFDIEVADFNGDGQEDLFLCTRGLPVYMYDGPVTDGKIRLLFRKPRIATESGG